SSLSSRYLLGFAACSGSACRESLVQSSDGVRWMPAPGFAGADGRQPSLVRRGATLYLLEGLSATPSGLTGPLRRFRTQGPLTEQPAAAVAVQLANPGDAQAATALTAVPVLDDSGALALVYALTYPAS